jgi:glutamate 5-kinase
MENKTQTLVIKLGTSTLTAGTKTLNHPFMREIVHQVAKLHEKGTHVVIVTSGAINAGRELLQDKKLHRSVPEKQMFAAVGQVQLMRLWSDLFTSYNIPVGQILLTRGDFSNRKSYLNARNTIQSLIENRIIPIINENDTTATREIRVGDNDNLSALVANLIGAELLILLTDIEGLYTADPRIDPHAKIIPVIEHIDASILGLANKVTNTKGLGTGGMRTKLEAAQLATNGGTATVIAASKTPNVIVDLAEGKKIGTLFLAKTSLIESRKRWLLSEVIQGEITVDAGAAERMLQGGASLLPIGVKKSAPTFDRGSVIRVLNPEGKVCAIGITNYSHEDIHKLIGVHSSSIENVLGYSYGPEIIHRDNMVTMQ